MIAAMCGRFFLNSTADDLSGTFGVDVRDNFPARYNIAPTQPIALIRMGVETRARGFALARWGFIPSWAKKDYNERMGAKPLINARGETAHEKPTFRAAMKRRRCLIPANGFYEWKTERGEKQPYAIRPSGAYDQGPLFAFAGIWETALDPDGGEIDTAAIITIAAGPDISGLHGREPVVIRSKDYADWLEIDERDINDVLPLIRPALPGWWRYGKVSKDVNNARHEGEALVREIGQGELF